MSNIFTYAIDERNLKVQLQGMQMPVNEQAWQKFEMYADAHPLVSPQNRFQNLRINLNRNVVLPVVFGLIICIFSFLLFNFISIKDPQKVENANLAQPEIVLNNAVSTPFPVKPAVVASPANNMAIKITPAEISQEQTAATAAVNTDPAPSSSEPMLATAQAEPAKTEVSHKRKRKNTEEEQLSEIRPTTVSDDDVEVEIVPN